MLMADPRTRTQIPGAKPLRYGAAITKTGPHGFCHETVRARDEQENSASRRAVIP